MPIRAAADAAAAAATAERGDTGGGFARAAAAAAAFHATGLLVLGDCPISHLLGCLMQLSVRLAEPHQLGMHLSFSSPLAFPSSLRTPLRPWPTHHLLQHSGRPLGGCRSGTSELRPQLLMSCERATAAGAAEVAAAAASVPS